MDIQSARNAFHNEFAGYRSRDRAVSIDGLDLDINLSKAVRAGNEIAVRIDHQLGHIKDVDVAQL